MSRASTTSFIARIARVGDSYEILLPKNLFSETGIKNEVKITVRNNVIKITAAEDKKTKSWADFKKVKITKPSKEDLILNQFDKNGWT